MKHAVFAIMLCMAMFVILDIIVSISTGKPYGFLAL